MNNKLNISNRSGSIKVTLLCFIILLFSCLIFISCADVNDDNSHESEAESFPGDLTEGEIQSIANSMAQSIIDDEDYSRIQSVAESIENSAIESIINSIGSSGYNDSEAASIANSIASSITSEYISSAVSSAEESKKAASENNSYAASLAASIAQSIANSIEQSKEQSRENSRLTSLQNSIASSLEQSKAQSIENSINNTPKRDVIEKIDPPKIYISTNEKINKEEYVNCSIKVVDPSGKYSQITDNYSTIKVRGNSTSGGEKKPYNFKFNSSTTLLGLGKGKKWTLLANMYDKSLMRNALSYNFAKEIGMAYVTDNISVEVYLNGTYRGMYLLTESLEAGADRVDINTKGNEFLFEYEPRPGYSNPVWINISTGLSNIFIGFNDTTSPTEAQIGFAYDFFDKAAAALMSNNYNEVQKYFDIDSFVDSYIVNEFFKNIDYSTSSTRFYLKNGKLYAGPVWDLDLSSGNVSWEYYSRDAQSYEYLRCDGVIWNQPLFTYKQFSDRVKARYSQLQPAIKALYQETTVGNRIIPSKIDIFKTQYADAITKNFKLWKFEVNIEYELQEVIPNYPDTVEYFRNWLKNRNEWLLKHYGLK